MDENKEAAIDFFAREMQLKPSHARRGWEYYSQHQIWHPDADLSLKGTEYAIRIYMEQVGGKAPLAGPAAPGGD